MLSTQQRKVCGRVKVEDKKDALAGMNRFEAKLRKESAISG